MTRRRRGTAMVFVLLFVILLGVVTTLFVFSVSRTAIIVARSERALRAFHLAEAGLEKAIWELQRRGPEYTGEAQTPFENGTFSVTVSCTDRDRGIYKVMSRGAFPASPRGPFRVVSATVRVSGKGAGKRRIHVTNWRECSS